MTGLRSIAACAAPYRGAQLCDVRRLAEMLPGLDEGVLLHAGPPYEGRPAPAPVRNAAAQALLFEGAAADFEEALRLLDGDEYFLAPAQDYGVVTPLAQVVSASMPVLVVGDEERLVCAPVVEGPPPALRFGSPDAQCLAALRAHASMALRELGPALREHPVDVADVVAQALAAGDECHSRTAAANQALIDRLDGIADDYHALLAANPGFVLPVIMAASAWALAGSSSIESVGGNGLAFGVRLSGAATWRTAPAQPPQGMRLPGAAQAQALGAIGDSAVIDFCGLGGQALHHAPTLVEEWRDRLPPDWAARAGMLVDPANGTVSAARIAASGMAPIVHLAMVGATPAGGIVGRGFYLPPVDIFAAEAAGSTAPGTACGTGGAR